MNTLEMKLHQTLASLGDNAEEVAAFLLGQGCKGHKNSRSSCPVATYLHRMFDVHYVNVSGKNAFIAHGLHMAASIPMPESIQGFVELFDAGHFPELVESR